MKRFLLIVALLFLFTVFLKSGDTLQYRIAYYPTWAYENLSPWNIDWDNGLTHVILFSDGNVSNVSPYWSPTPPTDCGFSNNTVRYLDSLVAICHRNNIKVLITIQAVDATNFNYVATDSIRTQMFHNTLRAWIAQRNIDGWDLDLEGDNIPTTAQLTRFIRIGRRNSNLIIGIAASRGQQDRYAPEVDNMISFYDIQCYSYQWMWNDNLKKNATWFQTPVISPASCSGCQNSSLSTDYLSNGGSLIDGWVSAGHLKSKIVIGYSTSLVAGFLGTDQLNASFNSSISDKSLKDVENMINYGGVWIRNSIAKASYIAGTATAGNPLGISAGTKFFLPFEDSTDMKAGIDYIKNVGGAGIMFYDFYGDRKSSTIAWKRTPYIYTAGRYAAKLAGQITVPPVMPPVIPPTGCDTVKIIVHDTVKVWDNITYSPATVIFADTATTVILPKGTIVINRSYSATNKRTTLSILKPKQ
jgi:hypothetical protein